MYFILRYDYVPNIVERREPFRAEHLSRLMELHEAGVVAMAGAAGDPPDHAVIVFDTDDRSRVEQFAESDPYVLNGLVTTFRIDPWNVVVGGSPK
jgi:uncharacterized protein YciI